MGLRSVLRRLLSSELESPTITEKEAPPEQYLYMFYKFDEGSSLYSLYSLNLDNPKTPQTILEMDRDKYPLGMGCVNLGSKLYFIGGQFKVDGKIFTSRMVYVFDLLNNDGNGTMEEGPKMHAGKANPVLIVAHEKIYVFGGILQQDPNKNRLVSLPHFGPDDMTEYLDSLEDEVVCEVFDPKSNQWGLVPHCDQFEVGGHSCGPFCGYVFVGGKIFLCGPWNTMNCFDINTQQWEFWDYYDRRDRKDEQHDVLAHSILLNGIIGRGLVVDNTFFTLSAKKGCTLSAYHLVNDIASNNKQFANVSGLNFPFSDKMESTGGSIFAGADVVHLGGMKFCLITDSNGPQRTSSFVTNEDEKKSCKNDVLITTFEVIQDKRRSGEICWSADVLDSCVLAADSGSFLYCFTL